MNFKIKVIPNAPKFQLLGFDGQTLKIKVKSAPEKGKANLEIEKELKKNLARKLGLLKDLKAAAKYCG